jgi:hypothetical protein
MYIYICIIYACMHTYTHTHISAHMDTHTHANIHTRTQALRWRVIRCGGKARAAVVEQYCYRDILNAAQGRGIAHKLLDSEAEKKVKEEACRLLNCLSNYNVGRTYILR